MSASCDAANFQQSARLLVSWRLLGKPWLEKKRQLDRGQKNDSNTSQKKKIRRRSAAAQLRPLRSTLRMCDEFLLRLAKRNPGSPLKARPGPEACGKNAAANRKSTPPGYTRNFLETGQAWPLVRGHFADRHA